MVGEAMEKALYEAAAEGDVTKFKELHQQDKYLVERITYAGLRNVLHIATMHGQEAIVDEVLEMNPQLARNLDSQKSSPLHIAAAQGHVEIGKKLFAKAPEVCWCRDGRGMNPVHVAAMNGHVGILKEMLRVDLLPAMERAYRGQTVLHLCVKHGQDEALSFLVNRLGDLVNAKDDDGETLLHWAVRRGVRWVIRPNRSTMSEVDMHADVTIFDTLVRFTNIEKQPMNSRGKTAKQIFEEISSFPINIGNRMIFGKEIKDIKYMLSSQYNEPFFGFLSDPSRLELLPKRREQTMVVMTLIATMAFQAAVSPPGGVWQDDTPPHRAGEAVIASTHPKMYKQLVRANSTAFVSSLITIFLLAVQQRVEKGFLLLFSSYVVWVSLASIAVSYGGSVLVIARPKSNTESLSEVIEVVVAVSLSFFGATLLWHIGKWLWSRRWFHLVFSSLHDTWLWLHRRADDPSTSTVRLGRVNV